MQAMTMRKREEGLECCIPCGRENGFGYKHRKHLSRQMVLMLERETSEEGNSH